MDKDLIRKYDLICREVKQFTELKEELRKQILKEASAEVRPELLPRQSFSIPHKFFEVTGLSIEDFISKSYPGWEITSHAIWPPYSSPPERHGFDLRKKPEYSNYHHQILDDQLSVDITSADATPEVDWDTLEKEFPEMVDRIGKPEFVYKLDEELFKKELNKNDKLPEIMQRHIKARSPVMRVKVKETKKKCSCIMPTYYSDPEGAKGHCTCGAL